MNKCGVTMFASQFQRVADGIVPQGVNLYLITVSTGYRLAIHNGIHPGHGQIRIRRPYQHIVIYPYVFANASTIGFEHLLHGVSVLLPDHCRSDMFLQCLQSPEEPQRGIYGVICTTHIGEEAVMHFVDQRVDHIAAILYVPLSEGDAGQSDKGIAAPTSEPWISGDNRCPFSVANNELSCRMAQAREKVDLVGASGQLFVECLF